MHEISWAASVGRASSTTTPNRNARPCPCPMRQVVVHTVTVRWRADSIHCISLSIRAQYSRGKTIKTFSDSIQLIAATRQQQQRTPVINRMLCLRTRRQRHTLGALRAVEIVGQAVHAGCVLTKESVDKMNVGVLELDWRAVAPVVRLYQFVLIVEFVLFASFLFLSCHWMWLATSPASLFSIFFFVCDGLSKFINVDIAPHGVNAIVFVHGRVSVRRHTSSHGFHIELRLLWWGLVQTKHCDRLQFN